jgi:hypothetical protein
MVYAMSPKVRYWETPSATRKAYLPPRPTVGVTLETLEAGWDASLEASLRALSLMPFSRSHLADSGIASLTARVSARATAATTMRARAA